MPKRRPAEQQWFMLAMGVEVCRLERTGLEWQPMQVYFRHWVQWRPEIWEGEGPGVIRTGGKGECSVWMTERKDSYLVRLRARSLCAL
jgi:hypothetical protein